MKTTLVVLITSLATGCASVTTRAPICEPPAIPPELLVPCEEPMVPDERGFGAIYESYVRNVVGPWARCIRGKDKLIEIVKYRDAVCAKIKADNMQPPKRWWEF